MSSSVSFLVLIVGLSVGFELVSKLRKRWGGRRRARGGEGRRSGLDELELRTFSPSHLALKVCRETKLSLRCWPRAASSHLSLWMRQIERASSSREGKRKPSPRAQSVQFSPSRNSLSFPDLASSRHRTDSLFRMFSFLGDVCRRRKHRCDGPEKGPEESCSNCLMGSLSCTYVESSKRRATPKGYVETLENRLARMTELLAQVCRSHWKSSIGRRTSLIPTRLDPSGSPRLRPND